MKNKYRNKRIIILMVISQILLTGFMVQWLSSQYHQEKSRLNEELVQLYIDSHDEMVDTILFRRIIEPVLSDTIIPHGKIGTGSKGIKRPITAYAIGVHGDSGAMRKTEQAIITIRMNEGKDTILHEENITRMKTSKNDFLLRGIKLFIGSAKNAAGTWSHLADSIPTSIDTAIFRTNYVRHLSKAGKVFHLAWDNAPKGKHIKNDRTTLLIRPISGINLPEAMIRGYQGYLLRNILPQILFGMVLVIITAIAFFAAYRNIRNQMILNEIRNEFISNMTHELKTPVSTMKIALESLLSFNLRNDPAITEEYLKLASQETSRLENLINRVLDHTFLEGNDHPFSFREIIAGDMIDEVIKIMSPRFGEKGSIRSGNEHEVIKLSGDKLYLQGVLLNLIDNSIKYCDKDPEIIIGATVKKSCIEITVTDNGPGVPEEYRKKIFDKFFRISSGDIHNIKGYGLGLSYAALVMKGHGGDISVINLNPGCTFILKFPA
jgi:signal transduction histidine kinase